MTIFAPDEKLLRLRVHALTKLKHTSVLRNKNASMRHKDVPNLCFTSYRSRIEGDSEFISQVFSEGLSEQRVR